MADFIDAFEASGGVTLVGGTDTPIFMLDSEDRFRLAADRLQWIVQRCKGVTRKGSNEGKGVYREHGFCTTRVIPLRVPILVKRRLPETAKPVRGRCPRAS